MHDRSLEERLGSDLLTVPLAPDEIYQAPLPADLTVRMGKLRVSEFLADGREVTRAVLQAGAVLRTRTSATVSAPEHSEPANSNKIDADPESNLDMVNSTAYPLDRVLLMALGEGELWVLPAGTLPEIEN